LTHHFGLAVIVVPDNAWLFQEIARMILSRPKPPSPTEPKQ
jgi:hypothetical protein